MFSLMKALDDAARRHGQEVRPSEEEVRRVEEERIQVLNNMEEVEQKIKELDNQVEESAREVREERRDGWRLKLECQSSLTLSPDVCFYGVAVRKWNC